MSDEAATRLLEISAELAALPLPFSQRTRLIEQVTSAHMALQAAEREREEMWSDRAAAWATMREIASAGDGETTAAETVLAVYMAARSETAMGFSCDLVDEVRKAESVGREVEEALRAIKRTGETERNPDIAVVLMLAFATAALVGVEPPHEAEAGDAAEPRQGGAALISAERIRQVQAEGWTPEHDDEHKQNDLAIAAAVYALPHGLRESFPWRYGTNTNLWRRLWPWDVHWFKPEPSRVRELVKAGALIAAEIDRLQRADSEGSGGEA